MGLLDQAPDVLTVKDCCRMGILPYSENTLRQMCARGDIPAVKPKHRRSWLIPKAGLIRWLDGGDSHGF